MRNVLARSAVIDYDRQGLVDAERIKSNYSARLLGGSDPKKKKEVLDGWTKEKREIYSELMEELGRCHVGIKRHCTIKTSYRMASAVIRRFLVEGPPEAFGSAEFGSAETIGSGKESKILFWANMMVPCSKFDTKQKARRPLHLGHIYDWNDTELKKVNALLAPSVGWSDSQSPAAVFFCRQSR